MAQEPGDLLVETIGCPPVTSDFSVHDIIIKVVGVNKAYRNRQALRSVNLAVRKGETLGVIGPNGAGKTTLLEILMGLRRADSGSVVVLGIDMDEDPTRAQRRIGVQLQDSKLVSRASVREYLNLFSALYGAKVKVEELSRVLKLDGYLDQRVGKLSGGQLQRLTLGLAIVGEPEIIFLDEPTTGLDPIARRELWHVIQTLKEGGRTVVLVTHYMEEIERLCDRVAVVVDGRIKAIGTPAEVAASVGAPGAKLDDVYEVLVSAAEGSKA